MLRFKVVVSLVLLILAALLAPVQLLPGPGRCIAVGDPSVQITSMPWHADLHIAYLSSNEPADYRSCVSSRAFTARGAARTVASAEGTHISRHRSSKRPVTS